jgi:hypothetical protein
MGTAHSHVSGGAVGSEMMGWRAGLRGATGTSPNEEPITSVFAWLPCQLPINHHVPETSSVTALPGETEAALRGRNHAKR